MPGMPQTQERLRAWVARGRPLGQLFRRRKMPIYSFDQEPKFAGLYFISVTTVRNEVDVLHLAFGANICVVLNQLLGPDYEFSSWTDATPGSLAHYAGQLILSIEIKKAVSLNDIDGGALSDAYQWSPKSEHKKCDTAGLQLLCAGQLQYGVVSTYENHWFLRRTSDDPSKLYDHQSHI